MKRFVFPGEIRKFEIQIIAGLIINLIERQLIVCAKSHIKLNI